MSTHDDGGPAFPAPDLGEQEFSQRGAYPGMTLRDYFAAKAMPVVYADAMKEADEGSGLFLNPDWRYDIALNAYAMADAMLKARGGAQ